MVETRPFANCPNPSPVADNENGNFSSGIFEVNSEPDPNASHLRGPDLSFLSPPINPGELGNLGSYRVLKVIGHGGMGVVLEAEDTMLKRPVALKVMKKEFVESYSSRERFLQEARSAALLESDHIVTIYQVGMANDVPYLAMQLLHGEPLDARLERSSPLPMPEAITIARQICEGLEVAHEHGLVHRDIKPANIWLECDHTGKGFKRTKLLDFGLARNLEKRNKLTNVGIILGTPQYMSPEQASGMPVDCRSDLFSLGTLLYVMLTGELPFNGPTAPSLLLEIVTKDPVRPKQLNCTIPDEIDELVMKLLAKKVGDRPDSARVVSDILDEIMIEYSFLVAPKTSGVVGFQSRDASFSPLKCDAAFQERMNAATMKLDKAVMKIGMTPSPASGLPALANEMWTTSHDMRMETKTVEDGIITIGESVSANHNNIINIDDTLNLNLSSKHTNLPSNHELAARIVGAMSCLVLIVIVMLFLMFKV